MGVIPEQIGVRIGHGSRLGAGRHFDNGMEAIPSKAGIQVLGPGLRRDHRGSTTDQARD